MADGDHIMVGFERFEWDGDWPPPYHIQLGGVILKRVSYSRLEIPHPNVARGAIYEAVDEGVEQRELKEAGEGGIEEESAR